jgi:four helix bundle protein
MRNFRKYEVYQDAMNFVVEVYRMTKKFPQEEKYGLTSQIRRATVSIPSNIAEGAGRESEKEFKRYIEISIGSSFEVETQLTIAYRLEYLETSVFETGLKRLQTIQRQLTGLRNKLKEK